VRRALALVLLCSVAAAADAVVDDKGASPDLEKAVGDLGRCYDPFAGGPSNVPGELLVAGTVSSRASSAEAERSPFVMTVDLEARVKETVFEDERTRFIEVRGAARLDATTFVVAGVTAGANTLAVVEASGKVAEARNLNADVDIVGVERGSARDFLVFGRFGSRPYYAGLGRSLAPVFERFPGAETAFGQVLKARYARARDGIWMIVQGADSVQGEPTLTLVKHDLLGKPVASTTVKSLYGDFEETADGIVLLHYTAAGQAQNLIVSAFDATLKPRWVTDPVRAQRGLLGPKLAVLKDKVLVVAADEFKLALAAFDLQGKRLWVDKDDSPAVSPGSTYFVAHDQARLLLAQPDRRAVAAAPDGPDPTCTRIRVVRF
jgi:hypothetical protein